MVKEFEKHFLSLEFATGAYRQLILESCTFDTEQDGYLPNVKWMSSNDADECIIYCCMLNTAYLSFKRIRSELDEKIKQLIEQGQRFNGQSQLITDLEHKNSELTKHINEQDLIIKRLIESEDNIGRACVGYKESANKALDEKEHLQQKIDKALERANHACVGTAMFHKQFNDVINILRGEEC